MTAEEYINLMKRILPVRKGRYDSIINSIFNQLSGMDCFNHPEAKQIQLRIISSASIFSELANTTPKMTLFWDTYQWEIIEKMLVSALLFDKDDKTNAIQVFKQNLYPAISIRLTRIAPELSYVFAKRYRELLDSFEFGFVAVDSDNLFNDLLYTEILSLGHEFAHLFFAQFSWGQDLYSVYEKDFFILMEGAKKTGIFTFPLDGNDVFLNDTVQEIRKPQNADYLKELICDIFSFSLVSELISKLDERLSNGRTKANLFDDTITLNSFVIQSLDTLSYVLDFWTRFGCISTSRRTVRIEDLHCDLPNLSIWKNQYSAREYLVPLYLRTSQLRDYNLYIPSDNQKYLRLYNATLQMYGELMRFADNDWAQMIVEYNYLLEQRIPLRELIEARDSQLGI